MIDWSLAKSKCCRVGTSSKKQCERTKLTTVQTCLVIYPGCHNWIRVYAAEVNCHFPVKAKSLFPATICLMRPKKHQTRCPQRFLLVGDWCWGQGRTSGAPGAGSGVRAHLWVLERKPECWANSYYIFISVVRIPTKIFPSHVKVLVLPVCWYWLWKSHLLGKEIASFLSLLIFIFLPLLWHGGLQTDQPQPMPESMDRIL